MRSNVLKQKSFSFAIRIVKLYRYLCFGKKEYVIAKQVLRSGTAVGALVYEAEHAESKIDFKHKLSIAQKEINETLYWIELLSGTGYLSEREFQSIYQDAVEIMKLITSIILSVEVTIKNTTR